MRFGLEEHGPWTTVVWMMKTRCFGIRECWPSFYGLNETMQMALLLVPTLRDYFDSFPLDGLHETVVHSIHVVGIVSLAVVVVVVVKVVVVLFHL